MNIAVFASGNGSNFAAIAAAIKKKKIRAKLALVVCDNPAAYVVKRAQKAGVKVALVKRQDFSSKKDFEEKIIEHLEKNNIRLIVLAGFMRMLGQAILKSYKNRILNIHPALLPSFKGSAGIKDAFDYGVKVTGVTVHFVDALMDNGPVILQAAVSVQENDTLASLEAKIHKVEHRIYPEAINLFAQGKLKVKGRKVEILNP
ncbi:MAG: phosphoribosylglycinamide formyltransferase [Candidatus Omnitrophota bacterium]